LFVKFYCLYKEQPAAATEYCNHIHQSIHLLS
jgi:hypothetical protein